MEINVADKILDAYLRSFTGRRFARQIVKTSEDIAADISAMMDIGTNTLSEMMLARGYELTESAAGVVGWLLYSPQ
ncbi:MAG: hypothetical protein IJS19_05180 [Muribaculaceae bacterium]|nr:hypothetical protein [Muribaculaceae bacterium]